MKKNVLIIETIQGPEDIVIRLYDLGLFPGMDIQIVKKISFNSVTIIHFGETFLALNQEELSCLRGS
ncbi:MAG: FeoA family protein [Pseudobdellovibrio sp.]